MVCLKIILSDYLIKIESVTKDNMWNKALFNQMNK